MANSDGSKSGGRQKGTPNKKTSEAQQLAERLGVDPFEVLLYFASGDWKSLGYESGERVIGCTPEGDKITVAVITPELRAKSASDATRYIYPARKAIDLTSQGEGISLIDAIEEGRRRAEEAMLRKRDESSD